MAKILYGIQSEGLGHYPRSKLIIDHLVSQGHQIKILTGGRVYDLMKGYYDVEKVARVSFTFNKRNGIHFMGTLRNFIIKYPERMNEVWLKIRKIFDNFDPDLVISDMEVFSAKVGVMRRLPIIYVGNGYSLTYTLAGKDLGKGFHKILRGFSGIANILSPNSKYVLNYIIPSFFKTNVKKRKKGVIVPSLIRKEILKVRPKNKNHILVYQTTTSNEKLASILEKLPNEKFIVYNFQKSGRRKNIIFKKIYPKNNFIKDLATCKAIITNGGFGLISEGVFLGKPILSNPIGKHLEQILNAVQLNKLGYGEYTRKLTPKIIKSFLYDLEYYKKNLDKSKHENNSEALSAIDKEVNKAIKIGKNPRKSLLGSSVFHNYSISRTLRIFHSLKRHSYSLYLGLLTLLNQNI